MIYTTYKYICNTTRNLYLVKGRQQEKVGHTQQQQRKKKSRSRRRNWNWEIKLKKQQQQQQQKKYRYKNFGCEL